MRKDWNAILEAARDNIHEAHDVAHEQRWVNALKKVHRKLKDWTATWESRRIDDWCHGDLHMANAMTRLPAPAGPAMLFDFASTRPGHWIEDAVYLERQYWGHEAMLHGVKPVSELAHQRRQRGLPADGDYAELAAVRRVLMAASAPAMAYREGNHRYLHSAHEVLERNLHQAAH